MTLVLTPPRPPSVGMNIDTQFAVRRLKFGDGYSEDSPEGINSAMDTATLTWASLTEAEATALRNDIKGTLGAERISYALPDDAEPRLWVCTRLSKVYPTRGGRRGLRVTLEERVL